MKYLNELPLILNILPTFQNLCLKKQITFKIIRSKYFGSYIILKMNYNGLSVYRDKTKRIFGPATSGPIEVAIKSDN